MRRKLERFEDYDVVLDYYKKAINHWSKVGNIKQREPWVNSVLITPYLLTMVALNDASATIARCDAFLEEYIKENPGKEDECNKLLKVGLLEKKFTKKKEMSTKEMYHQIRNALAHLNYEIYSHQKKYKNDYIVVENEYVKGKIKITELREIANNFEAVKKYLSKHDYSIAGYDKLVNSKLNDELDLDHALLEMKLAHNKIIESNGVSTLTIPKINNVPTRGIDKIIPLSKEERRIIKNYIKYYGLHRWNEKNNKKIQLLSYLYYYASKGEIVPNANFYYYTQAALGGDGNSGASILAPLIFNHEVLQYSYLCLNLLKETAKTTELEEKIFSQADLEDINVIGYKDVINEDLITKRKEKIKNSIDEIDEQIISKIKQIENVFGNKNLPEEKRNELVQQLKDQVLGYITRRKSLREELSSLKQDNKSYLNTIDFYNKLRNSISHNYIYIDYNSGLQDFDLYNTVITFYDKNQNGILFEFKITIRELLLMYDKIFSQVKKNADYFQDDNIVRVGFIDHRSKLLTEEEAYETCQEEMSDLVAGTKHDYELEEPPKSSGK